MRREAVESTTMKSVGYQAREKTLEIEFQSGMVYQYLDVPQEVYEGLLQEGSKGQYFNREIRDAYECVRMSAAGR
jgi:hypothetical protein